MLSSGEDITLWKDAASGNRPSFGLLFSRYYPLLYQYGRKIHADDMMVEDAIQELFLEIWQKQPPPPRYSVKAYLLQSLKFKLYRHFRRENIATVGVLPDVVFDLSHEDFIIEGEQDAEKIKAVLAAINQLPARQKEIIYLKLYKGLPYEEISDMMQLNYQVVRNLFCQALKTFRKLAEPAAAAVL